MRRHFLSTLLILVLPAVCAAQQVLQQPLTYDRINFSVAADREVENDTVTAILYVQREGSEAGTLADQVNKEIDWAVETAKEVPAVKVESRDYQTIPVYAKQTITGWRVRQSIALESRDTAVLSDLLGRLQQRTAIQSISYSISPELRQKVEKDLIAAALDSFQERAQMVTGRLGRSEYRIVNLDIGSGGGPPVRPMARSMLMSEAAVSSPTLESGTGTLSVTVQGTIELQVR